MRPPPLADKASWFEEVRAQVKEYSQWQARDWTTWTVFVIISFVISHVLLSLCGFLVVWLMIFFKAFFFPTFFA